MSNINIQKLMMLSKLEIKPDKLDLLQKDIKITMNMIDKIKELDCSKVEPSLTSVCSEMTLRMRQDSLEEDTNNRNSLFSNLSEANSKIANNLGYFIVPKVVK